MAQGPTGFQAKTIEQMISDKKDASMKKYFVSDSAGDPTDIYYAQAAASGGESCLRQRLEYYEVASGVKVIQKESWETAQWGGASWEI